MLSIQNIMKIKDDELKHLLLTFYSLHPTDINDDFYKNLYNSTDDEAIKMRLDLARLLKNKIINNKLMEAIQINDDYKYLKKIEVSDNLLLTKNKYYMDIYKQITGDYPVFDGYDILINFIRDPGLSFPLEMDEFIDDFTKADENKPYYDRKKSIYLPFLEERQNLRDLLYIEKETNDYTQDTLDKRNKALGNVGEYFVEDYLNNIVGRNTRFIAKEIGDGTGYDHHYILDNREMLIESKATVKEDCIGDCFSITNNEYNVMLDSIDVEHRTYTVARAFIDPETINCKKILLLRPKNEKELQLINYDKDYIYQFDHEDEKGKIFIKRQK